MHRLFQRFCWQDLFEQMTWQLKWFSTMRSQPNLTAVSFYTFVLIQQSTERWMAFCLSWLTLASLLWFSMLSLLNWFCCWSYRLKCQQCEGMAWNCWCWRYLDFYREIVNPTWQSWTQIRTDSREENVGRWESLWACRAQGWILTRHADWSAQSIGIKIDWWWHLP